MRHAVFLFLILASVALPIKLLDIRFEGLKTVPQASLTELVSGYIGEEITLDLINTVKKAVLETGYFKDARADLEDEQNGMVLVLSLKENPVLKDWKIEIEGPGLLEIEKLEENVNLEKGVAFNAKKAYDTLLKLKKEYEKEGYFLIEVNGNLEDDGVYRIKILEYGVWDLVFEGETRGLDEEDLKKRLGIPLLKDYYSLKPLFRLFLNKDNYYPKVSTIQALMYRLSEMVFFSKDTRLDFKKVQIPNVKDHMVDLVVTVKQRRIVDHDVPVQHLEITGMKLLKEDEIREKLSWILKDRVSNFEILKSAQQIIDEYSKKGYMMVWVIPEYSDGTLKLDVREKYISDMEYDGLETTKDYLVDDMVTFRVGEPLEKSKILETYGNLNRSNYFDKVDIEPLGDKESTEVKLILKLKEKEKKFQFIGGVAWAPPKEEDWWMGFAGQLDFRAVNPYGLGQVFSIALNFGFKTKSLNLEYSIPRPFLQPFRFDGRAYYTHTSESTETGETTVSTITQTVGTWLDISSLPFWNNTVSAGAGYELKFVNDEPNNTLKFRVGHVFDNRDSSLNPKRGFKTSERFEKAGFLNLNSEDYLKLTFSFDAYGPIWEKFFWAIQTYGGGIDLKRGDEKITLAYYNGIRGYPTLEGLYGYRISSQIKYSFLEDPVPMNALVFYDFGKVTDDFEDLFEDPLYSYGIGLEIVIPILTNVEFGYCYKSKYDSWDLYFLLGARF